MKNCCSHLRFIAVVFLVYVIQTANLFAREGSTESAMDHHKASLSSVRKIKDLIIYKDSLFYCAFPSVVKRPDGEIIVAFRWAPERRLFGEEGISHTDGERVLKRKITILKSRKSDQSNTYTFMGGYLVRSEDGGRKWTGPIYPPHVPTDVQVNVWGRPIPAYNRGALCEGRNGRIYGVVASNSADAPQKTQTHLLYSDNKGITWNYSCLVASDKNISFDETSVIETTNGDLGYSWSVMLDKRRALVVYYFNNDNGIRYIAGTIIEIN